MELGVSQSLVNMTSDNQIKFAADPITLELKKVHFGWIFGESRRF